MTKYVTSETRVTTTNTSLAHQTRESKTQPNSCNSDKQTKLSRLTDGSQNNKYVRDSNYFVAQDCWLTSWRVGPAVQRITWRVGQRKSHFRVVVGWAWRGVICTETHVRRGQQFIPHQHLQAADSGRSPTYSPMADLTRSRLPTGAKDMLLPSLTLFEILSCSENTRALFARDIATSQNTARLGAAGEAAPPPDTDIAPPTQSYIILAFLTTCNAVITTHTHCIIEQ